MSSGGLAEPAKKNWFQKLTGLVGGLVGVGLLGLLDWQTGTQVSFAIVYLLPIGFAAWHAGTRAGVMASGVAAAVWLALEVHSGVVHSHPLIHFWNVLLRLGGGLLTALFLGRLRLLTDNLEALVKDSQRNANAHLRLQSAALEAAANAIVITDRTGNLIWANPAFTHLTGYSVAEVLGHNVRFLKSSKHDQSFYQNLWQTILAGKVWQAEMVNRRKDGSFYPEENTITPVRDQRGEITHFIAVKRDLIERKKAERRSAVFGSLGHKLSAAAKPEEAGQIIMDMASELFGWDAGYVHFYSAAEDRIIPILTVDTVNDRRVPIPSTSFTPDPSPLMRQVMSQGAQLINRPGELSPVAGLVPFGNTQRRSASMMYVPIHSGGNPIGVLSIQSYTPHAYAPDDLSLLQALADHCGNALYRIRVTEAMRASEERFRTLFESSPLGIAVHGPNGRIVETNSAYQRLTGYTAEELRQLGVKRITDADDIAEGQRLFEEIREGKRNGYQREKRYRRKDGGLIWGQSTVAALRGDDGQLRWLISMVEDITKRKKAESLLRENERKIRLIAENATDAIFAFDMDRRPVYGNPAVERLTGYSFAEIQAQGFINWSHPDDKKQMLQRWEELFAGRGYAEVEFRLITKAGGVKWCSSTWGPLLDEAGRQIGVQGRERDVTELRRALDATRQLASIVESSQDAVISATPDRRIASWNKAAERMFGYRAEEVLGKSVALVVTPDRAAEQEKVFNDLIAGKAVESFESVRRRKDGSLIHVFITLSALRDATGKITGLSTIMHDFTERKRLEKEVVEISASERRRLGDDLHDGLGQYLTGIAFRAKALEQTLTRAGGSHAQEANEVVAMISNAMAQTHSLARGLDPIGIETIGLVAALQILAAETEAVFNLTCRFHCADTTLSVDAQKALALYRIVQEAIHNAITHGEARQITIELAMHTDHLCLRVQDDGTGFTAGTGNLTGMGLRVMQYRARSIEARLEINSQINHGTEIQCLLPRAACFPSAPDAGPGA